MTPQNPMIMMDQRILIIEDDAHLLRIYMKALRHAGYRVYQAPSIAEARRLLERYKFLAVVADVQIGDEYSTDLLKQYRQKLLETHTRLIVVSAGHHYRVLADNLDADLFLEKPVSINVLVKMLQRLVAGEQIA